MKDIGTVRTDEVITLCCRADCNWAWITFGMPSQLAEWGRPGLASKDHAHSRVGAELLSQLRQAGSRLGTNNKGERDYFPA